MPTTFFAQVHYMTFLQAYSADSAMWRVSLIFIFPLDLTSLQATLEIIRNEENIC